MLQAKKLRLGVFIDNPNARHCYEAVGFYETDQLHTVILDGKEWQFVTMFCEKEE